jgi:hypothetical protein
MYRNSNEEGSKSFKLTYNICISYHDLIEEGSG